jgi:hypothetical protein
MGKRILAILIGIIAGVVVISAVQSFSHFIYQLPAGIKQSDTEAMKNAISSMPFGAFLLLLLSYVLGSFSGGLTSALIYKQGKYNDALIIGCILMIMGFLNLLTLPHPAWFWVASLITYIPMSLLGARIRR